MGTSGPPKEGPGLYVRLLDSAAMNRRDFSLGLTLLMSDKVCVDRAVVLVSMLFIGIF